MVYGGTDGASYGRSCRVPPEPVAFLTPTPSAATTRLGSDPALHGRGRMTRHATPEANAGRTANGGRRGSRLPPTMPPHDLPSVSTASTSTLALKRASQSARSARQASDRANGPHHHAAEAFTRACLGSSAPRVSWYSPSWRSRGPFSKRAAQSEHEAPVRSTRPTAASGLATVTEIALHPSRIASGGFLADHRRAQASASAITMPKGSPFDRLSSAATERQGVLLLIVHGPGTWRVPSRWSIWELARAGSDLPGSRDDQPLSAAQRCDGT
jgi:hypothetical protein